MAIYLFLEQCKFFPKLVFTNLKRKYHSLIMLLMEYNLHKHTFFYLKQYSNVNLLLEVIYLI